MKTVMTNVYYACPVRDAMGQVSKEAVPFSVALTNGSFSSRRANPTPCVQTGYDILRGRFDPPDQRPRLCDQPAIRRADLADGCGWSLQRELHLHPHYREPGFSIRKKYRWVSTIPSHSARRLLNRKSLPSALKSGSSSIKVRFFINQCVRFWAE